MRTPTTLALAAIFALATLTGCGSDPATATLVMPAKAATAEKVSIEGAYSEPKAGLEVTLTAKGDTSAIATTTTAKDGRYKLTFTPEGTGKLAYVATVTDGDEVVKSKVRTLLVMAKTVASAKLRGGVEAQVGDKRTLVGKVQPAEAARTVVLETSPDAQAWTATTTEVQTSSRGGFRLPIDTTKATEMYVRAVVKASETHLETATVESYLGVYDYQAAGKRYLKCTDELNAKLSEYQDLTGLETLKGSAARMSTRNTDQAKCFRGYTWPPAVASDVEELAMSADRIADVWNQMAAAETQEEYDELSYEIEDTSQYATRTRATLGLPKRPNL